LPREGKQIRSVAHNTLIGYYIAVQFEKISYPCFFTLSLAAHLALVPLLWRKPFMAAPAFDPISVSFLPAPKPVEREKTITAPPLSPRRLRQSARAQQLKRAPVLARKPPPARPQPEIRDLPLPPQLAARTEPAPVTQERPPAAEARPGKGQPSVSRVPNQGEVSVLRKDYAEKPVGREQLLPGIRDLTSYGRPIPLNTRDPILAPFTKKIESWIEAQWEYPDLAKQFGLQGKVTVEFTVLQNGHIDLLSVVDASCKK